MYGSITTSPLLLPDPEASMTRRSVLFPGGTTNGSYVLYSLSSSQSCFLPGTASDLLHLWTSRLVIYCGLPGRVWGEGKAFSAWEFCITIGVSAYPVLASAHEDTRSHRCRGHSHSP